MWTKQELEEISDRAFINAILGERRAALKGYYSPLSMKLKHIMNKIDDAKAAFDENGNLITLNRRDLK